MKRNLLYIVLCTLVLSLASCGAKRSQAFYDQPSRVLSADFKITAFYDAQRKVVKEIIFDGIQAANNGVSDLKPLCLDMNAQEKYEDYWNAFFSDGGPWKQFTNYSKRRVVTTRYERDGRQMIETGTVTVDRAGIKKKLQEDGIIPKEGRY